MTVSTTHFYFIGQLLFKTGKLFFGGVGEQLKLEQQLPYGANYLKS